MHPMVVNVKSAFSAPKVHLSLHHAQKVRMIVRNCSSALLVEIQLYLKPIKVLTIIISFLNLQVISVHRRHLGYPQDCVQMVITVDQKQQLQHLEVIRLQLKLVETFTSVDCKIFEFSKV